MNTDANGKVVENHFFLDQALTTLYDFGDGAASKKKLKSQKRKKRKRCEEKEKEEISATKDTCSYVEATRIQHPSAADVPEKLNTDSTAVEQTGLTVGQTSQVEVVTFQDPTKRPKTKQMQASDKIAPFQIKEKMDRNQAEELSLEKARLEVHRFGITGYKKEQQRVFEQERAIMLGARPPKKEYVNYKVLQQQIKAKQKAKEEVQPDLKKKKKQNKPRAKKASSVTGSAPSGQVGRFRNGMLILSSKEIQKIKGSKGRK